MKQSPFWEGYSTLGSSRILCFYITQRFITVFTRAYHRSLFWARWIQSTHSNHSAWQYIFYIFPFTPRSSESPSSFQDFHLNFACISLLSMLATCLVRLIVVDFVILIIFDEEKILWSSSLCIFLQPPCHLLSLMSKCYQHPVLCFEKYNMTVICA
jgi:hypothetical protein